ncbi:MAG: hypothetical protein O2801_08250, partial [Actinomycetota bacterium]|nr:hypothetical protein [Actinomycetota bacterium]
MGLFDKTSVLEQRWVREGTTCTNSLGEWTITGVGNGQYFARLWGQGTGVIDGFYRQGADAIEDTALATTITVSNAPVTGVAVVGGRGKTVSGTISRPAGNYEICVSAWEEGAAQGWRNWRGAGCTRTSTFSFTVPDGTYRFEYSDRSQSLRTIWSGGATTFEEA